MPDPVSADRLSKTAGVQANDAVPCVPAGAGEAPTAASDGDSERESQAQLRSTHASLLDLGA